MPAKKIAAKPAKARHKPNVHRLAINISRIISVDESSVVYKTRHSHPTRVETKKVAGEEFVDDLASLPGVVTMWGGTSSRCGEAKTMFREC